MVQVCLYSSLMYAPVTFVCIHEGTRASEDQKVVHLPSQALRQCQQLFLYDISFDCL